MANGIKSSPDVEKLRNDSGFYNLPADVQRAAWGMVDPDFNSLPLTGQDYFLRELQSDYVQRQQSSANELKREGYDEKQVKTLTSSPGVISAPPPGSPVPPDDKGFLSTAADFYSKKLSGAGAAPEKQTYIPPPPPSGGFNPSPQDQELIRKWVNYTTVLMPEWNRLDRIINSGKATASDKKKFDEIESQTRSIDDDAIEKRLIEIGYMPAWGAHKQEGLTNDELLLGASGLLPLVAKGQAAESLERKSKEPIEKDQPLFPVGELVSRQGKLPDSAPLVLKAIAGAGQGAANVVSGLSTPSSIALLTAMSVNPLSTLPRIYSILASAGFSYETAKVAVQDFKKGVDAYRRGDQQEAAQYFTSSGVSGIFSVLAGKHATDVTAEGVKEGRRNYQNRRSTQVLVPNRPLLSSGPPPEGEAPSAAPAPPPVHPSEPTAADITAVKRGLRTQMRRVAPEGRAEHLQGVITQAQADLAEARQKDDKQAILVQQAKITAATDLHKELGTKKKPKTAPASPPNAPATPAAQPPASAPTPEVPPEAIQPPPNAPEAISAPSAPPAEPAAVEEKPSEQPTAVAKSDPKAIVEAAGGEYKGSQDGLVHVHDPVTQSTVSVSEEGLSHESVAKRLEDLRDSYRKSGRLTADGKLIPPSQPVPAKKTPLDEFEASGKEPWQITQKQWVALQRAHRKAIGQSEDSGTQFAPNADYEEYHKQQVKDALKAGKEVPAEVLAEYPDLKPAPSAAPAQPEAKPGRPAIAKITKENKQEAIDRLKQKLAAKKAKPAEPTYMAAGETDPEILSDTAGIGAYLFQDEQVQNYAQWSKAMVDAAGDDVEPYLKPAWQAIHDPETSEGRVALLVPEFYIRVSAGTMPTDPREVRKLAESIVGGKASDWIDDLYDSIEGAFNQERMETGLASTFDRTIGAAVDMEDRLGNRTRTIDITVRQQFSTPFPLSEGVRYAADIAPADLVQEITAGTGNLVATVPNLGRVVVNEIDPRRVAVLRAIGFKDVTEGNYLAAPERRPNIVETNPPWGAASTGKYAHLNAPSPWGPSYADISERFIVRALQSMAEPSANNPKMSRVSALMPTTIQKAGGFFKWLRENHTVRAMIQSPPDAYTKRGTKVDSILLVVDKGKIPALTNQPAPILRVDEMGPKTWEDYVEALKPLSEGSHARVNGTVKQQAAPVRPPAQPPDVPTNQSPVLSSTPPVPTSQGPSAAPAPEEAGALHIPDPPPGAEGIELAPPVGELGLARRTPEVLLPFLEKMSPARRKQYEEANASPAFVPYIPRSTYPEAPNAQLHPRQTVETRSLAGASNPELTQKLGPTTTRALQSNAISIEQADGISTIAQAWSRGHAALVADDVGLGKAREVAGAAAEAMDTFKRKRGLIITANENNILDLIDEFKILWGVDPERGHLPFQTNHVTEFKEAKAKDNRQPLPVTDGSVWFIDSYNIAAYQDAIQEAGFDFVVADEAHRMKNIDDSARGEAWTNLHNSWLPRHTLIAYLSATPASEIADFEYLYGLKEWAPGNFEAWVSFKTGHMSEKDFEDLKRKEDSDLAAREVISHMQDGRDWATKYWLGINKRGPMPSERLRPLEFTQETENELQRIAHQEAHPGVGSDAEDSGRVRSGRFGDHDLVGASVSTAELEQIMRELKMDGKYRSIDLWRGGVELDIRKMPLSPEESEKYTRAVMFVRDVIKTAMKYAAADKSKKSNLGLVISQSQAAMKRLQFDFRLKRAIEVGREQLAQGLQPILSLINVKEAKAGEGNIRAIIDMVNETRRDKDPNDPHEFSDAETIPEAVAEKAMLLERAAEEFPTLPDPIKAIHNAFGDDDVTTVIGPVSAAQRRLMMAEFQAGKKRVAVISAAGSTGISLHHVTNTEKGARGRRAMILVDYDWSAPDFKQRLGRVDRASQLTGPRIMPISLGAAAEMKFLATIATRMRQLGAASKGAAEAVGDTLEDFEFGNSVDRLAIREMWRLDYIPHDAKMMFRGPKFMNIHTQGDQQFIDPKRELSGVGFNDFSIQLQLMPIDVGNRIFDAFLKRREELYALAGEEVGATAASKTARGEGNILRFRKMQKDLDLYEVEDKTNHKFGILSGMVTPRLSLVLPFLENGQRKYVTFKAGDNQVTGLRLDWQDIPNIVRRIGPLGGVKHTPETALDDMRAGEKIPLLHEGWKIYMGRAGEREGKVIIDGAGMLNTDRGRKLSPFGGKFNSVGNFFYIPDDRVRDFLKQFPIRPEAVQPSAARDMSYDQRATPPEGPRPYRATPRLDVKTQAQINQELARAWLTETHPVKLPNGETAHIFNQGEAMPAEAIQKMMAEPYWQNVVQVLHGVISRLAKNFGAPEQLSRAGLFFPDDSAKQTAAYGVNVPHPHDVAREMIFISLFGNLEAARRFGAKALPTVWQQAENIYMTIVHEVGHMLEREHGAKHRAAMKVILSGSQETSLKDIEALKEALAGGSEDDKPHQSFFDAHSRYIEAQGRKRRQGVTRVPAPDPSSGLPSGPSYSRGVRGNDAGHRGNREALRVDSGATLYSGFAALENVVPSIREYLSRVKADTASIGETTVSLGRVMARVLKQPFDIDKFIRYKGSFGGDVVASLRRIAAANSYARFFRPYWMFHGGGNKLTEDERSLYGRYLMSLRKADMVGRGIPATALPDLTPDELEHVKSNAAIQRVHDFYKDHLYPMVEADHREAGVEHESGAEVYFPIVWRRVDEAGDVAYSPMLMPFGLPRTGFARKAMGESPGPGWELVLDPFEAIEAASYRTAQLAAKRSFSNLLDQKRMKLPALKVDRLHHAIASKDKRAIARAERDLGLSQRDHDRIAPLIDRGNATSAELAQTLLGGQTAQVWFGSRATDIGDLIHTQRTKIGLMQLGKRMREIANEPDVSSQIKELEKANAYQEFFDKYKDDLTAITKDPPEEVQHFVREPIGREYLDLIYPQWQRSSDTVLKAIKGDPEALAEVTAGDFVKFFYMGGRNIAVGARLATPSALLMHANRIVGLTLPIVQANYPEAGKKIAASIPLVNRLLAFREMRGVSRTPEGVRMAQRLAKIGALRPRAFEEKSSEAFNKIVDAAMGHSYATVVGGVLGGFMGSSMGPGGTLGGAAIGTVAPHVAKWALGVLQKPKEWVLGFDSLDMDARVFSALFLEGWHRAHGIKPPTDEQIGTFVMNRFGNYIRGMQTAAIKFLSDTGALMWAPFHIGAVPSELAQFYGGSLRLPCGDAPGAGAARGELPPSGEQGAHVSQNWWSRLQVLWVAALSTPLILWAIQRALKGKYLNELPGAKVQDLYIPTGGRDLVVADSLLAPEVYRPLRITGLEGIMQQAMEGERDPDAYISATIRGPENFILQESAQSPTFKPAFIFMFGAEPYLREDYSMGSAGVDTGDPIPARARAKAALINMVPAIQSFYGQKRIGEKGYDVYLQSFLDQMSPGSYLVDMDANDDRALIASKIKAVETQADGVANELFLMPEAERRKHYEDRVQHVRPELQPIYAREIVDKLARKWYGHALDTGAASDRESDRKVWRVFDALKQYEKVSQDIGKQKDFTPEQRRDQYLQNDARLNGRMQELFNQLDEINPPQEGVTGNPFRDLGSLLERLASGPPR